MIWDFRVIKRQVANKNLYEIHRVFYSDPSKSRVILVETFPSTVVGIEPVIMLQDIEMMTDAFDRPTLYLPEWNT